MGRPDLGYDGCRYERKHPLCLPRKESCTLEKEGTQPMSVITITDGGFGTEIEASKAGLLLTGKILQGIGALRIS